MKGHEVPVVKIGRIEKHPNADSLSITETEGSPVIVRTQDFKEGDLAIYIPIESLIPEGKDWVKKHCSHLTFKSTGFHRLKAARLRGVFSMGMLVPFAALQGSKKIYGLGDDVMDELGIEKFEEPFLMEPQGGLKGPQSLWIRFCTFFLRMFHIKQKGDPIWSLMTSYGVDQYRKNKRWLNLGEPVIVSEKIHGSCFCAAIYKKKFRVSSHHTPRPVEDNSIYWQIARKYDLKQKYAQYSDLAFFGEIYGPSVQDMGYGLKTGGLGLRIFDVMDITTRSFLSFDQANEICKTIGLEMVPILYRGPFSPEVVEPLCDGPSLVGGSFREGFVIKPAADRRAGHGGRVVLKMVGQKYLLRKNGTERH